MAYFSKDDKAQRAPAVKAVLKKFNVKASLSVSNHSTFVCTLISGPFNFDRKDGSSINHYWIKEQHANAVEFLTELKDAMMVGNHNRSDVQTDYFDVGFYISIDVGRWDKPYVCTAA